MFHHEIFRRALLQKTAFTPPPPPEGQAPGPGGAPMDPAAGGMPPMDPAGMPPVDPAALGVPPVNDPATDVDSDGKPDTMVPLGAIKDLTVGIIEAMKGRKTQDAAPKEPEGSELPPGPVTGLPGDMSGIAASGPLKMGALSRVIVHKLGQVSAVQPSMPGQTVPVQNIPAAGSMAATAQLPSPAQQVKEALAKAASTAARAAMRARQAGQSATKPVTPVKPAVELGKVASTAARAAMRARLVGQPDVPKSATHPITPVKRGAAAGPDEQAVYTEPGRGGLDGSHSGVAYPQVAPIDPPMYAAEDPVAQGLTPNTTNPRLVDQAKDLGSRYVHNLRNLDPLTVGGTAAGIGGAALLAYLLSRKRKTAAARKPGGQAPKPARIPEEEGTSGPGGSYLSGRRMDQSVPAKPPAPPYIPDVSKLPPAQQPGGIEIPPHIVTTRVR